MSKVKYAKVIYKDLRDSISTQGDSTSGTLENYLQCRKERLEAQLKLLRAPLKMMM
jgi:hypothetical protein